MTTKSTTAVKLGKDFLAVVEGPIWSCWQAVGSDAEQACEEAGERLTNPAALEMCIDANRLLSYPGGERGHAAEDAIGAAIDANGYPKVLRFLSRHIKLA